MQQIKSCLCKQFTQLYIFYMFRNFIKNWFKIILWFEQLISFNLWHPFHDSFILTNFEGVIVMMHILLPLFLKSKWLKNFVYNNWRLESYILKTIILCQVRCDTLQLYYMCGRTHMCTRARTQTHIRIPIHIYQSCVLWLFE